MLWSILYPKNQCWVNLEKRCNKILSFTVLKVEEKSINKILLGVCVEYGCLVTI